jgi:hypothetical protein
MPVTSVSKGQAVKPCTTAFCSFFFELDRSLERQGLKALGAPIHRKDNMGCQCVVCFLYRLVLEFNKISVGARVDEEFTFIRS